MDAQQKRGARGTSKMLSKPQNFRTVDNLDYAGYWFFCSPDWGEKVASLVNKNVQQKLIICSRWLMPQDYKRLQLALVTRGAISHPELLTHFYVLQSQITHKVTYSSLKSEILRST